MDVTQNQNKPPTVYNTLEIVYNLNGRNEAHKLKRGS
jgi:hypothetical protein